MRTTVTLEPDVAAILDRLMKERGITFKEAVNEAIRAGASQGRPREFRTRTFRMGHNPSIPLDKALQLAAGLEDEELARRLAARK